MEIRSYLISGLKFFFFLKTQSIGICSKRDYLFGSAYGSNHYATMEECLKKYSYLSTKVKKKYFLKI